MQGSNAGFSKLMNRLLGVHVDMQRKIFDYFTALQASVAVTEVNSRTLHYTAPHWLAAPY